MSSPEAPASRVSSSSRLRSLDGLRGVAAGIVVLHHALLLNPGVSTIYLDSAAPVVPGSLAAIVTRTPLQLFFSGQEAVLVFFVLSGLVVALPPIRRPLFDWRAYYPQRLVRLLLPVSASIVLAAILAFATLRDPSTASSGWASGSVFASLNLADVVRSFDVLVSADQINNPLWSLRYEVLFSVMLPLFVIVAIVIGRRVWIGVVAVGLAVLAGWFYSEAVWAYLPIFLLGTLIAVQLDALGAAWERISPRRRLLVGSGLLLVGLLALEAHWIFDLVRHGSVTASTVGRAVAPFGAAIVVVCAVVFDPMVRFLETRLVQWLGRISFSLYLVHVPILIATAGVLRSAPWWAVAAVGIPVAVIVAVLFSRFVEGPSHRLSRRIGRAISSRWPVFEPVG